VRFGQAFEVVKDGIEIVAEEGVSRDSGGRLMVIDL
jgi:hypothetical protein